MRQPVSRIAGMALSLGVCIQIGLGIWNVVGGLPLWVAVGHNAGAALLLLSLIYTLHLSRTPE